MKPLPLWWTVVRLVTAHVPHPPSPPPGAPHPPACPPLGSSPSPSPPPPTGCPNVLGVDTTYLTAHLSFETCTTTGQNGNAQCTSTSQDSLGFKIDDVKKRRPVWSDKANEARAHWALSFLLSALAFDVALLGSVSIGVLQLIVHAVEQITGSRRPKIRSGKALLVLVVRVAAVGLVIAAFACMYMLSRVSPWTYCGEGQECSKAAVNCPWLDYAKWDNWKACGERDQNSADEPAAAAACCSGCQWFLYTINSFEFHKCDDNTIEPCANTDTSVQLAFGPTVDNPHSYYPYDTYFEITWGIEYTPGFGKEGRVGNIPLFWTRLIVAGVYTVLDSFVDWQIVAWQSQQQIKKRRYFNNVPLYGSIPGYLFVALWQLVCICGFFRRRRPTREAREASSTRAPSYGVKASSMPPTYRLQLSAHAIDNSDVEEEELRSGWWG